MCNLEREYVLPTKKEIPQALIDIQQWWKEKSNSSKDQGPCVLGAGFEFIYMDQKYFMPPISSWQGCFSWESFVNDVKQALTEIGATEIIYCWGSLD